MYLLLKTDGTSFQLENGKSYVIGRKDCDITLNDKAVSKKHANITIRNEIVYVIDLKSSNKTIVNGCRLTPNVEIIVKANSIIIFGSPDSTFTLKKDKLIITMSGLSKAEKEQMMELMKVMSGSILTNWSPTCTHIVASEMILTVKVLSALISKQPIVTVDYFKARRKFAEGEGDLPKIEDFQPLPPKEHSLKQKKSIDYNIDRTSLFKNKTFVFPNDQSKKKIDSVIKLAGGNAISFDSKPLLKNNLMQNSVEYVFIITADNSQSENSSFNDCVRILNKNNRRSVPLSEIAMAITSGNCETDCNTSFNKIKHIMAGSKSDLASSEEQDVESQTQVKSERAASIDSMLCLPSSQSQLSSSESIDVDMYDSQRENTQKENGKKSQEKKVQIKLHSFFKRPNVLSTSKSNQKSTPEIETIVIDDDISGPSTSCKRKSQDLEESSQKKHKSNSDQTAQDKPTENDMDVETIEPVFTSTQNSLGEKEPEKKTNSGQKEQKKLNFNDNPFNSLQETDEDSTVSNKKNHFKNPFASMKAMKTEDLNAATNSMKKVAPKDVLNFDFESKSSNNLLSTSTSSKRPLSPSNTNTVNNKKPAIDVEKTPSCTLESVNKRQKCISSTSTVNKKTALKETNIFTSTRIEDASVSRIEDASVSTLTNLFQNTNLCRWLSKDTPSVSAKKMVEMDEDTRTYIASFRPARVEIIPSSSLLVRKPFDWSLHKTNTTNNSTNSSKPNFKKFKKVQPLHPQTYIIPSANYISVICGENAKGRVIQNSIQDLENVEEEEVEEQNAFEFNH